MSHVVSLGVVKMGRTLTQLCASQGKRSVSVSNAGAFKMGRCRSSWARWRPACGSERVAWRIRDFASREVPAATSRWTQSVHERPFSTEVHEFKARYSVVVPKGTDPRQFVCQAETKKLLDIVAKSLYTDKEARFCQLRRFRTSLPEAEIERERVLR